LGDGIAGTTNRGTINAALNGIVSLANNGTAAGLNAGGVINSGLDGMVVGSNTGNALAQNTNLGGNVGIINAAGNGMNVFSNLGGASAQNNGIINAGTNGMLVQVFAGTADAQALNTGIIIAQNDTFSGMRVHNFGTGAAQGQNDGIIISDAAMEMQSFNGGNVLAINNGILIANGPLQPDTLAGEQNTNGVGIFVRSQGGAHNGIVQAANFGTIVSNGNGIFAQADEQGSGVIQILNEGSIHSTERNGIRARNDGGSGAIQIANDEGIVVSDTQAAISVRNLGTAVTQIANSGILLGDGGSLATAVISIDNTGVGANNTPTLIANSGLIAPNTFDPSRLAIATLTTDGVVQVANTGAVVGRVDLTDGNDIFANGANGVWSTAGRNFFLGGNDLIANAGLIQTHGTTEFSMDGGANVVNNSGVIQVLNGGAAGTGGTGRVLFSSVGGTLQFNNAGGLIDMSTDVGNRTENTVVIQGNFNASGNSRLGVDTFLGAPGSTSDRLGVQGNVTGATSIIVHDVNPGPGAFNPTGIAVVNISGAGNLSNFQLSSASDHFNPGFGGVLDKGLFFYFLANDPNATSTGCTLNHCVSLFSLPSVTAQQLPIAITAAQTIFYETALMWEDRQTEVRDWWARGPLANIGGAGADMPVKARPPGAPPPPPPPRFGVWLKGMGSWADVDKNQTQSLAGQSFTFDLGYKQDTYAIVGGVDFGMPAFTDGVFVWGPMGGYVNSKVRFDQGGNTFKYTGGTVGLSASYLSGGFLGAGGWFADALVKADFLRLSVDTPLLASQGIDLGHVDVTTWGVIGNLGYRFNFGPAFFEPIGTLTYARVDIDNINNTLLGTNLNFGNGDSFRGAIGARLGTRFNWWAGHTNEAWILGRVWDEFAGNNNTVDLLNPGVPITVADDTFRHKAFGEVKAGLDFIAFGAGWSAHVNGGAKFGDDFTIWNAKGGVNYKW
jgi:outer membrane autotransporter protein